MAYARTKFGLCAAHLSAGSCRELGRRSVGSGLGASHSPAPPLPRAGGLQSSPRPHPTVPTLCCRLCSLWGQAGGGSALPALALLPLLPLTLQK